MARPQQQQQRKRQQQRYHPSRCTFWAIRRSAHSGDRARAEGSTRRRQVGPRAAHPPPFTQRGAPRDAVGRVRLAPGIGARTWDRKLMSRGKHSLIREWLSVWFKLFEWYRQIIGLYYSKSLNQTLKHSLIRECFSVWFKLFEWYRQIIGNYLPTPFKRFEPNA